MAAFFGNLAAQPSKFQSAGDSVLQFIRANFNRPESERETTIRKYQMECVLKIREKFQSLEYTRNPTRAIIVAPTGSGKSGIITLLPYILQSKKVLILTPAIPITNQIAESFLGSSGELQKCFLYKTIPYFRTDMDIDTFRETVVENGSVIRTSADVPGMELSNLVIVNAQKFGGQSNSSLFSRNEEVVANVRTSFGHFDIIIVDEAHHYPAPTWQAIMDNFRNKQIVFLTATPIRSNGEDLFSPRETTYEIRKADIEGRYVRHLEFRCHNLGNFVYGGGDGHWEPQYLSQVNSDIEHYLNMNNLQHPIPSGRHHQAMVLVRGQNEAVEVARYLNNATYCTSTAEGAANKIAFDQGANRILVICGSLREGYDNPHVSVCVILRRVRSHLLFAQFIGRCSRISHNGDQAYGFVISYPVFEQQEMWDSYDRIAIDDPEDLDQDDVE